MDRLVIVDPPDVTMRFEVGQKSVGRLQLINVMHTMPVAFTIESSAKNKYQVKPPYATIAPLGVLNVEITMHPQTELPRSFPKCPDKFVVKTVVVPGGFKRQDDVSVEWFTAKKKAVFNDSGLKLTFVGGGILRDLLRRGCLEEMREVLDRDPTVANATNERGETAMHLAISMNRPELVQILLEYRADLELENRAGQTPLMQAAQAGESLIVELLLANGSKTESKNCFGWTALHYATVRGHDEVMSLLLDGGADIDAEMKDRRTSLYIAVSEGHKHCLRLLLERGCNIDAQGPNGCTVLHLAATRGHVALVDELLRRGANRDVKNFQGRTPYQEAEEFGDGHLLDILFLGDNLRDAARKGDVKSVRKFLRKGAVIDAEDQHGWTALQRAAFKGRVDIVKYLVRKGASIHHKDDEGYTALHTAVESCQKDVVRFLLDNGAKVNDETQGGLTPLQIAVAFSYQGIVKMLVKAGALTDVIGNLEVELSDYLSLEGEKERHTDDMETKLTTSREVFTKTSTKTDHYYRAAPRSPRLATFAC